MSSLQTKVWQQIAGLVPLATDFLFIPVILQAACALAHSITRITYLCKLIGALSFAAFLQLELFKVYDIYLPAYYHGG
ncbi:Uncharacterised protein [Yersinia enterocolitica]|nr:Uncharacterised protein [Yersinia enterocolitica]